jgi:integrase
VVIEGMFEPDLAGGHGGARKAQLSRPVTCHKFPHCFATHLLQNGTDIRTVQELIGHKDVSTPMIYTYLMTRPGIGVKSPLDLGG